MEYVEINDAELQTEIRNYTVRHSCFTFEEVLACVLGMGVCNVWKHPQAQGMNARVMAVLTSMKHAGKLREDRSGFGFSVYHVVD
jgi:hypothetical protein